MAIAAVNLTYSSTAQNPAQGQIASQGGLTGSEAKSLYGVGTATLDGSSTTFTINWIDGVQIPFKSTVTIQLQSVTAPATFNGTANVAQYQGVGAMGQLRVGQTFTTAGFTNAGNNSTSLIVLALSTNTIYAVNASAVAETNPAGTATFSPIQFAAGIGQVLPASGGNARAFYGPFNNVVDTAATTTTAILSAITQTGCTCTISAAGSAGQKLSVAVSLYPSV
jgi:hypothetical protein